MTAGINFKQIVLYQMDNFGAFWKLDIVPTTGFRLREVIIHRENLKSGFHHHELENMSLS